MTTLAPSSELTMPRFFGSLDTWRPNTPHPLEGGDVIATLMERFGATPELPADDFLTVAEIEKLLRAFPDQRDAWLSATIPSEQFGIAHKDGIRLGKALGDSFPLTVISADVNHSAADYGCPTALEMTAGLAAITGLGREACAVIARERTKAGEFTSIFDFCRRLPAVANKRVLEALIGAGALDSTGATRKGMMDSIDAALKFSTAGRREGRDGMNMLALLGVEQEDLDPEIGTEEWSQDEILEREYAALGMYRSGHPLREVDLRDHITDNICDLGDLEAGTRVIIGGMLTNVKKIKDRKRQDMAFLQITDLSCAVEAIVFAKTFAATVLPDENSIVLVGGKVEHRNDAPSILVDTIREFVK